MKRTKRLILAAAAVGLHHHDIGLKSRDHFHAGAAVASLPDDDHVWLRLQQQGKSCPDQGFVVDKDNPQAAVCFTGHQGGTARGFVCRP